MAKKDHTLTFNHLMEMEFAAVRLDRSARVGGGGVVLGGRIGWNRNQRRLRDKEQKKMQDE